MMDQDMDLVREYAARGSEQAFAALVERHIGLVHSSALRQVRDPGLAEEITQAVFILLAQKAPSLHAKTILPGWLYRATRFTAANVLRTESNRHRREQEAHMQSIVDHEPSEAAWQELSPLLDEVMHRLGQTDRDALLLRYFENKSLREVGAALGSNEDAAKKRVARGLDKLRILFAKRGVHSTTAIIAGAISGNSVQTAPAALIKATTVAALAKGATAGSSTLTLIKGALKLMAWTKAKTAIVTGVVVLLTASATTAVVTTAVARHTNSIYEEIWAQPNSDSIPLLRKAPAGFIIRPTHYPDKGGGVWDDDGKGFGVNYGAATLVGIAYNWSPVRTSFPDQMPPGNFDLMEALPRGQNAAAFKEEIRKQFGLVAHKEKRETDVLLLRIKDPARLQTHLSQSAGNNAYMTGDSNDQFYHFTHERLSGLADSLEGFVQIPIVNRSGSNKAYDFEFQWSTRLTGTKGVGDRLREELEADGLELVPAREPIDMLVVERVKK